MKENETLTLAEEILKNIELQEVSLSSIALRCARLARITNNQVAMDLFKFELTGYPKDEKGYILSSAFAIARFANRNYFQKNKAGVNGEYMFPETIAELENELFAAKEQMKVAFDRDVSIASANPMQHVYSPAGNTFERNSLRQIITEKSKKIDQLRTAYYNYVLGVYYELKFKNISEDIFQKNKIIADKALSEYLPETFEKFVSVYENLESENKEDWANAVHSCRRVLNDLADFIYPADNKQIDIGDGKKIVLNKDNYIARLKEYIKIKSSSKSFARVVGSHLNFIGDRIDSLYGSTNKGTHAKVSQKEAESYVMYTYMLVGNIMDLYTDEDSKKLTK
jgi:hypothetical protein